MQKALFPSGFSVYCARIPLASLKLCISTNKKKTFNCKVCFESIKKIFIKAEGYVYPKMKL